MMSGDKFETIKDGVAEGELVGGNLSLIHGLVCGKYAIDFNNKILFLEELGYEASPGRVSNYLSYLKQNGVFNKINALWIGNYEHESKIKLEKIILDVLEDEYSFPIIKSDNFGHIDKKMIIPIGQIAQINTNIDEKIKILDCSCKGFVDICR